MVPFLFPCESVAPESDHEHSLPCLQASSGILHNFSPYSQHSFIPHGSLGAPGWSGQLAHTRRLCAREHRVLWGTTRKHNKNVNHWKKYIVPRPHAREWKDCGSELQERLRHVQQNSSTPVFNAAVCCLCCFPEWVCYPLRSQLKPKLHHFTQATHLLCHLKCDRQTSCPWAAVKCCTASLLQSQANCSLLAKGKDPLQKCLQGLGWKVLATAHVKCLLLPVGKSEAH